MRTLLQHIPTGRYFQSLEKWTTEPQKAHDFKFIVRALRFVTGTGFRYMELVLTLDDSGQATDSNFEALRSAFN